MIAATCGDADLGWRMTAVFDELPDGAAVSALPETARPAAARPDRDRPDGDRLDVAERHALRRVAGLSTELEDVSEVEYRALRLERVVLMGVWTDGTLATAENSLRELSLLAETAGSEVLDGLIQRRGRPDAASYVRSEERRVGKECRSRWSPYH